MTWIWLIAITSLLVLAIGQARQRRKLRSAALDAAHELARPLTALRLGLTAGGRQLPRAVLDSEVVRAASVVDQLRFLGGAGRSRGGELFDLSRLAEEVSKAWEQVAVEAGTTIKLEAAAPVPVVADRARIGQALTSIIANAIEHGEGAVRVALTRIDGSCRVEVNNSVSEPRFNQRRAASERTLRGRGLRIVEAAVTASGGRLDAVRAAEGRVVIELPLAVSTQ